jgi:hypothetical protein
MGEPEPAVNTGRGTLIRWIGWFGLANALLYALVGVRYLSAFGWPDGPVALTYVCLAFVGQFVLLGYLPMMFLLAPVALLVPRPAFVTTLGAVLAAFGVSLVVLDANIFAQYSFHLSALITQILDATTWVLTGIIFVTLTGFQLLLARIILKRVQARRSLFGIPLAGMLILVWCGGQGIHIWSDATAFSPVTGFTRYLPFYFPMKAKRRLAALGWVDPAEVEQRRLLRRAVAPDRGQLRYPLNPLSCSADPHRTPNILMLVVDALRPDKISPEHMPNMHRFAREGQEFRNHYSGGNSSRMGFFSMFYGIPSTYWQSFYDNQLPPVLMDTIVDYGYEISAISSIGFSSPAQIDRTVFADFDVQSLQVPPSFGRNDGGDKNVEITAMWLEWFKGRKDPEKPYFSFMFYDPDNFVPDISPEVLARGELARRYEQYMQGISAVDRELDIVLQAVDQDATRRETIVIIASDHGSVLLMDWPGRAPNLHSHRSAHQDLPATLLRNVFDCSNPADDYSSGIDLFSGQSWDWIMAGSYSSHAIVEPDKLVITYPGGFIELLNAEYRPDPELELDPLLMQDVMLEMRRFYR